MGGGRLKWPANVNNWEEKNQIFEVKLSLGIRGMEFDKEKKGYAVCDINWFG